MIILKSRSRAILNYILSRDGYVTLDEVAEQIHISKRAVYYDLHEIIDWLKSKNISLLKVERQRGIFLSAEQKSLVLQHLGKSSNTAFYTFSQDERLAVLICKMLTLTEVWHADRLASLCNVSRNTVLSDLKAAKTALMEYKLKLTYGIKQGYVISGDIIRLRAVFLYYLAQIMPLAKRGILPYLQDEVVKKSLVSLTAIEHELDTEYVDGTLTQLAILIGMMMHNNDRVIIGFEREEIVNSKEFLLINQFFPELPNEEQVYLAIHLLGARVQFPKEITGEEKHNYADMSRIAMRMIHEFERLACVDFSEKDNLLQKIVIHLDSSFYRYRYGILEGTPVVAEIEKKYPELFVITQKVSESLAKAIGYPIPKSDISYLTLHFGAHLRTSGRKKCLIKILIVCQNGVATAQILSREIEELLPFIEVVDIISARELNGYSQPYDLIVSTVQLSANYQALTVNPILTVEDKQTILAHVFRMRKSVRKKDDAERIFDIVKQYVPEDMHYNVKRELGNYFNEKHSLFREVLEQGQQGLADLITPGRIQLIESMDDWREGISLAAAPLLEEELINDCYVNAMIECVENYGPYIFITPDVALAHAKPEGNVNGLSASMLLAHDGILFPDNKVARVIIVLALIDDEQHLGAMKDILDFFGDEHNTARLSNAVNEVVAYSLIAGMPTN
ncbi:BglG family transcription antiterminator [Pelosinus sp. UFO1]|uniref:BglG family transcription antiterminator n=1 Tax=Pelosinus sp. UFO1 TaxID=484770 RepID=UPI0004D1AD70|nr:BglG family transcription antiterminator [Pelosinus sp. UFO1]AIF50327.1 PTS modulated transcriptional regulator, MtlR family [Pelosinus sp. UFO1]